MTDKPIASQGFQSTFYRTVATAVVNSGYHVRLRYAPGYGHFIDCCQLKSARGYSGICFWMLESFGHRILGTFSYLQWLIPHSVCPAALAVACLREGVGTTAPPITQYHLSRLPDDEFDAIFTESCVAHFMLTLQKAQHTFFVRHGRFASSFGELSQLAGEYKSRAVPCGYEVSIRADPESWIAIAKNPTNERVFIVRTEGDVESTVGDGWLGTSCRE